MTGLRVTRAATCLASATVALGICIGATVGEEPSRRQAGQKFDPSTFSLLRPLRNPTIRQLLKLSDEQTRHVDPVLNEWSDEFARISADPAVDEARAEERLDEYVKRAVDLLTPEQNDKLWRLKSVDFMTGSVPSLSELKKDYVRTHLKLSTDQIQMVDDLYVQWLTTGDQVLRKKGTDDIPRNHIAALLAPAGQMEKKVQSDLQEILDEAQRRRLGQLMLQWACLIDGPRVFDRPEVVERLALTTEQRTDFQRLARKGTESRPSRYGARDWYLECVELLDEQQQLTWKEMIGESYYPRDGSVLQRSPAAEPSK